MVLNDQAHLFALLDGLSDEKKNFLTYLFDKNVNRDDMEMNAKNPAFRKMESEVDALDGRVFPR